MRRLTCIITTILLTGCTLIVLPSHRGQDIRIAVQGHSIQPTVGPSIPLPNHPQIASIKPDSISPTLASPPVGPKDNAVRCTLYVPPDHPNPPGTPLFTQDEIRDPQKLNVRLVEYVNSLRGYILHLLAQDNDAYTAYQQSCSPQSKEDTQKNP